MIKPLFGLLFAVSGISISQAQLFNSSLPFTFPSSVMVEKFKIHVDPDLVQFSQTRASTYRPTYGLSDEWTNEGPPAGAMVALAEYWAEEYSWSEVEENLNKRDHYAITIQGSRNYTADIPLHFVHQKSTNESAIPLLMLHGWTSTHLEWDKIIEPLGDRFHIVAPDLPGFGFSPAPLEPGLGPREMATAFDALMQKLGYKTYGVIGTDIGYFVSSWMVVDVPESIIGHFLDFMLIQPTEDDLERYANNQTTPEENAYIEVMNEFTTNHFAYSVIQAQKPLALSLAMTDSPVGFAGWVWDLKYVGSDGYPYTKEEIITESFLIWLQAPYGAMRTYLEILERPESSAFPKSEVVTGVTQWGSENGPFPELADFPLAPRSWVDRTADNVVYFERYTFGGHFPAQSYPELYAQNVAKFFESII